MKVTTTDKIEDLEKAHIFEDFTQDFGLWRRCDIFIFADNTSVEDKVRALRVIHRITGVTSFEPDWEAVCHYIDQVKDSFFEEYDDVQDDVYLMAGDSSNI
jgi:hypothetical protein